MHQYAFDTLLSQLKKLWGHHLDIDLFDLMGVHELIARIAPQLLTDTCLQTQTYTQTRHAKQWLLTDAYVKNAALLLSPGCEAWKETGNGGVRYNFPKAARLCCSTSVLFLKFLMRVTFGLAVTMRPVNQPHLARERKWKEFKVDQK